MKGLTAIGTMTAKVAIVAAAALGGTALVSSGVFAALTATASNTSGGSVETGTLKLTQVASSVAGITGGFTTAIPNMAPGDTVNRYINVTNSGTLDAATMTLAIAASPSTTLTTDGTNGLQVTVRQCSVAWTNAGVCSGTTSAALASTSGLALGTAKTLTISSLAAAAVSYLQISLNLPSGNEVTNNGTLPVGTVQGVTSAITWTFTETLRTNTTVNS
ncbi:MAG: hypothetical protein H7227_02710 [Actinobacteria bacterium]|nr:hypothetical protein [Actinomycetota bacterium]